jgi:hypothetical protein
MKHKDTYIETLIQLIELNEDKTWLDYFLALRTGACLPGGGAASLNDWKPFYRDTITNAWLSNLYDILRHIFDNNLGDTDVYEYKFIKFNNNIRIIRCLHCHKSYQHPFIFESHLALRYYKNNFVRFAENKQLINLLIPIWTYENEQAKQYRNWLSEQYEQNHIQVYDFVANQYRCTHCGQVGTDTEHDLYTIKGEKINQKIFQRQKQNANWQDFEKIIV